MSNRKSHDPQTLRRYRRRAALKWMAANARGDVEASSRWFEAVDAYGRKERISELQGHARVLNRAQ